MDPGKSAEHNITADSIVAVIGTGCIGMAAAALARYRGAGQVYLIGRNDYKLGLAQTLGITGTINSAAADVEQELLQRTGGRYADFVLECSGNPITVEQAVTIAAQKAMIALIGFYEKPLSNINIDAVVVKELTVIGIMGEYGNLEAVSKILSTNDLHIAALLTDVVPFEQCDGAFHPDSHSRVVKTLVQITPDN